MNKSYRQGQILKLIRARNIYTQEELARELRSQGIQTTQVTLSRDIRELGLAKTPDGYREIQAEPAGPDVETVVREFLLDVRVAQNLIVLKTMPGHANTVAIALDHSNWDEVVGTLAGDDTILVICPDGDTAQAVQRRVLELLER
jgi:transcriptional regulator of arginine metabolism